MQPEYLEINGTITEDDPDNPGQLARFCYQRVAPGAGNLPGNGTFNRQRRRVVIPNHPNTTAQLTQRQKLTEAVQAWQALDADQRRYWTQQGTKRSLPGYNAFIANHMRNR